MPRHFTHLTRYFLIGLLAVSSIQCQSASETPSLRRIGVLVGVPFFMDTVTGFKAGMAELGYMEGRNIAYEIREAYSGPDEERRMAEELVAAGVDLILATPTEVSIIARDVAQPLGIPVVFANAALEGLNLVSSIREPGVGITGVRFPGPDLALLRFERLIEFVPGARHVLVPHQKEYPIIPPQMDVLREAAANQGITLIDLPATSIDDMKRQLDDLDASDAAVDAVLVIADPMILDPAGMNVLGVFAGDRKIPVGGIQSPEHPVFIFSVMISNSATGGQAARIIHKILRGTPAGDIPIESAETFFDINLKGLSWLGIEPPESLLSKADTLLK